MPPWLRDWNFRKCLLPAIACLRLLSLAEDAGYTKGLPDVSSWSDVFSKEIGASAITLSLENHTYWGKNEICGIISEANLLRGTNKTLAEASPQRPGRTLLNLTFSCEELFRTSGLGTGNWLSALYAMRLAVAVEGGNSIDLLVSCTDAVKNKNRLILPWIMGFWRSDDVMSHIPYGTLFPTPPKQKVCGGYYDVPIAHMLTFIRYELRRMAIALVGVPNADHPSAMFANRHLWPIASSSGKNKLHSVMQIPDPKKDEPPLYKNVPIDDAVVHFRCGDLMFSRHPSFGFMKFSGFSKWISPSARSIGIVTQPFDVTGQTRKEDSGASKMQKCKDLVAAFTEHLTNKFPRAQISIHNDVNETIALSFSRMIMANQTVVGISSFGVFPALASFGTGYIRKPDHRKEPNQWLLDPPVDATFEGIKLIEEPNRLWVGHLGILRNMGGEQKVIEWFRNDTFCLGREGLECEM